ncbi:MAG: hypothetical protein O7B30_00500 [Thaumarchaeota archaeon]|nr:hypothetical protein [Nitrososphaerota archaeon]
MTFRIACGKCGAYIYAGIELRYARDVLKVAGGKCRECGSHLSLKDFALDVVKVRV